ncbi:methyltransferase domain-containing protein [Sandaracinus amylolyticus]|uniref:methyltransferase domain-containing protein n=1 Tax=Sandaracinus amylolyticus TaxID=927083 RepID=UPI001F3E07D2|nr:methyltransferase domain-containing protein [Sandaracinus amylolyticus]UJR81722.1 Methyltransferase [Sandaracinus amylolyticus]
MTDREHGDGPDGTGEGSSPDALALAGRSSRRRTGRRRSLRVPVDEVPRRGSSPDGELGSADGAAPEEQDPFAPMPTERTQVSAGVATSSELGMELAEVDLGEELDTDDLQVDDEAGAGASTLDGEPTRIAVAPALASPSTEPELERVRETDPGAQPAMTDPPPPPSQPPPADERTSPGITRAADEARTSSMPGPQPAVIVSRVVAISTPPPAPSPVPSHAAAPTPAWPAHDEEPELSISESFDDLEVDVGDDERDMMAALADDELDDDAIADDAIADDAIGDESIGDEPVVRAPEDDVEVSAAELELPDDELTDAAKPPPPPARAQRPAEEEELAADDLEVEASGETDSLDPKKRSAPPPPPDKPGRAAPPPARPAAAAPAAAPASAPATTSAAEPAAEPARRSKKKGNWWEDFFNDDYLRTVPPPNPRQIARQCDFIEARLALKEGSTILDVGCGLGLHAIELTRRGYLVVGLDLSLPMLSRAADEAQDQGFRINFLHADMREMNFDGAFDAVLCWGTTFGYFDDDQNRGVVERLHRALRPKGKLLLEVVNRDFVVPNQPNLVWFEGDGCVVMEETQANFITSRLTVKRTVILDDGRQRDNQYSVRLYSLHELGQILHQRAFRVVEVSGREATPGVFFGADSPKLIILAERRIQQAAPPPAPKKTGSMDAVDAPLTDSSESGTES